MTILCLRTDKPEAELYLYDDGRQIDSLLWQAHRELAETIHKRLKELLDTQKRTLQDIQGVVVFKGPGSFTGLRIGVSVANALAAAIVVPIVGTTGQSWQIDGCKNFAAKQTDTLVVPEYGAEPHITKPKH